MPVQHFSGNWWVGYNGEWIGYFPDSICNGTLTSAGHLQASGEVTADNWTRPCNDMGTGRYGHDANAASIYGFSLIDSPAAPALNVFSTHPNCYDQGKVTATSLQYGGPRPGSAMTRRSG